MSYILDALRKLEQNRQHEESLTFLAFQGQAPKKSRKRRLWPYLLFAALIVNAGAIFWWVGPWQSPGAGVPAPPPAVRGVNPVIPASAPAADGGQRRADDGKPILAPRDVKEPPRAGGKEATAPVRSAAEPVPVPRRAPPAEPAPATSAKPSSAPPVRAEVAPPADGRVLKPADLPASVAGGLPVFKISLHYYVAEPPSRVVWINDRTLREGESLSEGLKVEQINEEGVVMNYRGWRFQVGLNDGR